MGQCVSDRSKHCFDVADTDLTQQFKANCWDRKGLQSRSPLSPVFGNGKGVELAADQEQRDNLGSGQFQFPFGRAAFALFGAILHIDSTTCRRPPLTLVKWSPDPASAFFSFFQGLYAVARRAPQVHGGREAVSQGRYFPDVLIARCPVKNGIQSDRRDLISTRFRLSL